MEINNYDCSIVIFNEDDGGAHGIKQKTQMLQNILLSCVKQF